MHLQPPCHTLPQKANQQPLCCNPTLVNLQDNTDALDKLDVKSSAEEIGIRPADFIQAIMADPELSKVCLLPMAYQHTSS